MKSQTYLLFLIAAASVNLSAQVSWQETFGGSATDQGSTVCASPDGGYLVASNVRSVDGDITNKTTADTLDYDIWLAKFNPSDSLEWTRAFGGTKDDRPYNIIPTSDGGYLIAGDTWSGDGDFAGAGFHGTTDMFLLKLDYMGEKEWLRCYGGSGYESAYSVIENAEGNYLVAGMTYNSGSSGDLAGTSSRGWTDAFILKVDSNGTILWKQRYGGNLDDRAKDMVEMEDGGYMVACEAESYAGSGEVDVNLGNNHSYDFWILKLNSAGQIQWKKNFGGTLTEMPRKIRRLADGSFVIVGLTESTNMDAVGNHGGRDGFLVRMDPDGNKIWSRLIGGSAEDILEDVLVLNDTTFMVAGYTESEDGDLAGNQGSSDGWISTMNPGGDLLSSMSLGSPGADRLLEVDLLDNEQAVAAGYAGASGGDVGAVSGPADIWVLKLGDAGTNGDDDEDPVEEGLVAHWPFDGNTQDTLAQFHLNVSGSVTYAEGKRNGSVKLESASYLTTSGLRSYYTGSHAFTVMFWFRKTSLVNWSDAVFSLGRTGYPGFEISYTEELIQARRFIWGGETYVVRTAEEPFSDYVSYVDDQWHHVATSYDGAMMALYLDGAFVGDTAAPTSIGSENDLYFGVERPGVWPCSGYLDDAYFFSRALTPDEITAAYLKGACVEASVRDTVTYHVSDAGFESDSPMVFPGRTDSLTRVSGGCDSIVRHYVQFIYDPVYCTDTLLFQDTLTVSDTVRVTVTDTTFVTVTDSISVTDTLYIDVVLTETDPPGLANTLKVYPNPAHEMLFIETGDYTVMTGYRLRIFNQLGAVVFENLVDEPLYQVDLRSWTGYGIYYLELIDPTGAVMDTRKIVLQE